MLLGGVSPINGDRFEEAGDRSELPGSRANWYALQTKPRSEAKAVTWLSRKAFTTYLPHLLVHRRHGSRRWESVEPLFRGYIFAKFVPEPQILDRVRWTPGVKKVLGDEDAPIPVPEAVVLFLQEREGEQGFIVPRPGFIPGARVRFSGGPFADLEGVIDRPASHADRVRVLLERLNTSIVVEVDVAEIERA